MRPPPWTLAYEKRLWRLCEWGWENLPKEEIMSEACFSKLKAYFELTELASVRFAERYALEAQKRIFERYEKMKEQRRRLDEVAKA